MKLVVGLGNPGERYTRTRHNAGFWVAEEFARRCGTPLPLRRFGGLFAEGRCGGIPVAVLCPLSFMNRSGECVALAVRELGLVDLGQDLIVAVDDLDLPLGRLRFRPAGSAGGHRGLESLIAWLGTPSFGRLRFGIGRPPEGEDVVDFVLKPLLAEELAQARDGVTEAAKAIETVLCEGPEVAMSRFNRSVSGDSKKDISDSPGTGSEQEI